MKSTDKQQEPIAANVADDAKVRALVRYLEALGIQELPRKINDTHIATRTVELQRSIDAQEFREYIAEKRQEELEGRMLSLQAQLYDKAASYNNVVISFGYAGFFAIWTFTKDQIHPWDTAVVALLLGASLIVFIAWTLFVSAHITMSGPVAV